MPSIPLTLTEAFREAFLHDRHLIMGREMLPFCIDHIMSLAALGSPLIEGGVVKIEDAQLAVKICSTASNQDYLDAALRPSKYWKKWAGVTRSYPIATFIGLWNDYVEDYAPKIEQFRYEDQDAPKCPGYILTAAKLVERGHDPAKVKRMGIGEVTAWALAIMENNPTPHNPNPLKGIKDDWDVLTAREKIQAEASQ
jgi:hypothetical protein